MDGLDGMRLRAGPLVVNFLFLALHPERVNVEVPGITRDRHRDLEASALDIDNFFKEKSSALLFGESAILKPDQRMHFGVFVDRLLDPN